MGSTNRFHSRLVDLSLKKRRDIQSNTVTPDLNLYTNNSKKIKKVVRSIRNNLVRKEGSKSSGLGFYAPIDSARGNNSLIKSEDYLDESSGNLNYFAIENRLRREANEVLRHEIDFSLLKHKFRFNSGILPTLDIQDFEEIKIEEIKPPEPVHQDEDLEKKNTNEFKISLQTNLAAGLILQDYEISTAKIPEKPVKPRQTSAQQAHQQNTATDTTTTNKNTTTELKKVLIEDTKPVVVNNDKNEKQNEMRTSSPKKSNPLVSESMILFQDELNKIDAIQEAAKSNTGKFSFLFF